MSTAAVVSQRSSSKLQFLFGLSAIIILVDRITKVWVSRHIDVGDSHTVIPHILSISHVMNDGAAFSLFSYSSRPQLVRVMLISFSVIAATAVFVFLLKMGQEITATTVALALILGGALGNLYDRLAYGTVIDFLEVHIIVGHWNYHWPDFNVADSAIVVGGILLFLGALLDTATGSSESTAGDKIMTADEVKAELERVGLVPVLRAKSIPEAHALVEAIYAGGVTVIEVTMTVPGAIELLRDLKAKYGSEVLLGSGTVTTAAQAQATIEAGAEFVQSRSLHLDVIAKTKELGKVSIPGALTPTEVITAWEAGADYVKVFPCSALGGASYLKALRAPFPQIKLIPTGGVTVATAADFLKAGAMALGVGSDLVNSTAIAEGKSWIVTDMARAYMDVIQETRAAR